MWQQLGEQRRQKCLNKISLPPIIIRANVKIKYEAIFHFKLYFSGERIIQSVTKRSNFVELVPSLINFPK